MEQNKENQEIKAVSALVLAGSKQDMTALFIQIKRVSKSEKEKLLEIIAKKIYLHKAVLSQSKPGSILALFNVPAKQYRQELEAIKAAEEIKKEAEGLKSLIMGIGLHTGKAIISAVEKGVMRYTCLGDVVDLAKRLASKSDEIALSKAIYDKTEGQIKAKLSEELTQNLGMPIHILIKTLERERYEPYIQQFVKKLEEEKAKEEKK